MGVESRVEVCTDLPYLISAAAVSNLFGAMCRPCHGIHDNLKWSGAALQYWVSLCLLEMLTIPGTAQQGCAGALRKGAMVGVIHQAHEARINSIIRPNGMDLSHDEPQGYKGILPWGMCSNATILL